MMSIVIFKLQKMEGEENGEGWENKLIHTYKTAMRFQRQATGHLIWFYNYSQGSVLTISSVL